VTCAMRRTLVSRKARKRRIAENAEMNGDTYYANRNVGGAPIDNLPKAESPPPLSSETMGSMDSASKAGGFATFEMQKQPTHDDMTPLNPRNPSVKTNSSNGRDGSDRNPSRGPPNRGRQPVDQYGNPIPPLPTDGYMMQNQQPRMGPPPPNRGGPQMYGRGRGGPPRGGYGPPPRGAYGPRGGMRGGGPPPPGWNGNGRGMRGPGPMPGPGPMARGAPPPGYNNDPYAQGYAQGPTPRNDQSPYGNRNVSPPHDMQPPMPIGQAIEMDARTGTPPLNQSQHQNQNYGLRESDGDVQGMLALQQGGFAAQPSERRQSGPLSPSSNYSQE
jgi:hypothetical protein